MMWRFNLLDVGSDWCWSKMTESEAKTVYDVLGDLERKTWTSIPKGQASVGSAKRVVLDGRVPPALRKRLLALEWDDQDHLWEIRCNNKARIWLLHSHPATGHLVWWDPNHEVWPRKS